MQKQFPLLKFWTFLLALCMCVTFSIAMPDIAKAERTIKWVNKTTENVSMCLRYYDAVAEEWVTRGWWVAKPLSTMDITLNTNSNTVYYYAETANSYWGGKEGDGSSVQHTIVDDEFTVKGDVVPRGKGQINVWFRKIQAENGLFTISLNNH